MTKVAVVILNYNGRALLQKFLPLVIQHTPNTRIVVVDNGSTDDSQGMVASEFPKVELIRFTSNYGFCGGYNKALKEIDTEFYVLLNSDVEVTAGWLPPLLGLLNEFAHVAAVQPKILSYERRGMFEYAGAGGGQIDSLGYPFCRGRLFYREEEDIGQFNDSCPVFWASGACMLIRSSLFHSIGGFDEDFFAHMEEIDLCWRLQRAGYSIHYVGSSAVYHVGGGTLAASNPRKTYFNFRNGLSLLYKNLPTGELFLKFPLRIVLDWIAGLKFALTGSAPDGLAVLRAHIDFFGRPGREISRRRSAIQLGFRELPAQYRGSVVFQFFVLQKRKFSQLDD